MSQRMRQLPGALSAAMFFAIGAAWCLGQESRPAAGRPAATLRTWAILASDELRKSGLEDQVLAGLGTDKTITLVDREHIDLVVKEQALGVLSGGGDAASRRKAGAIAKADAMAIVYPETANGEHFVRLVICETRAGARLLVDCIAYKADGPGQAAKAIVAAIEQTRRRFPLGVQRVYAVPAFVSRDLGHEYDHLQRGFASMLANALSSQRGVAVVEIDEARQIAGEIAVTDGADIHRIVPLFIEGEYDLSRGVSSQEPSIRFGVKVTGNGKPANVPVRTVKLSEMAAYLSRDLPVLLLGGEGRNDTPLTADQQAAALVARADVFARLGAWEHSTALREAALLLKDDPVQRIKMIGEYCRVITAGWRAGVGPEDEGHLIELRNRAALWGTALAHVEYVIRNRQASFDGAMGLTEGVLHSASILRVSFNETVPIMERLKNRFLREVWPLAMSLKFTKPYPRKGEQAAAWTSVLVKFALYNYETNNISPATLDFLSLVLLEMFPADQFPSPELVYHLGAFLKVNETAAEASVLLDKLVRSDKPGLALLARMCRLNHQWLTRGNNPDLNAFGTQANRLLADYKQAAPKLVPRETTNHFTNILEQGIKDLDAVVAYTTRISAGPAPKVVPTLPVRYPTPLLVEPVDLQVKTLAGKIVPFKGQRWRAPGGWGTLQSQLRCGDVDVFWNNGAILVMREKGILEEIAVDEKVLFQDLRWDKECLWVGTRNDGIRVIDLTGRIVARIGARDGLPDADRGMKICPVAPGKAVVAGSLGEHKRLWVAMVQRNGDRGSVNVFHRATRVLTVGEDWSKVPPALDLAGEPRWMHLRDGDKNGLPPTLLLGWGLNRRPMQVNLDTLKVSLFDKEPSPLNKYDYSQLSREGRVIEALGDCVLLRNGADTYKTGGGVWWRLDTGKGQFVELGRMPVGLDLRMFGTSAHYGMVGWTYAGEFFRLNPVDRAEQPAAAHAPVSRPAAGPAVNAESAVKQTAPAASNR